MPNLTDLEPDISTKIALLTQEANQLINQRFLLQARYRRNKRIGAGEEIQKALEGELEYLEKAIAAIDEEIRSLAKESKA